MISFRCPECQEEMEIADRMAGRKTRCPECDARLPSAFQVECEECGTELRPNELFGGAIRRPGR